MSQRMPLLFVGHGSPMNALADNDYTRSLSNLARRLPSPQAILVISAHWLTTGTHVSCTSEPKLIYDFYGFPRELYEVKYPCEGAPQFADMACSLVTEASVSCNDEWGIDHAAWAVLKHIYPLADIPVFELSLDYKKPPLYHYNLARQLLPLRDQGVLIVGSGNAVHNLRVADFDNIDAAPFPWAQSFEAQLKTCLQTRDHHSLLNYHLLPNASKAVPTNEHYLPLLYFAALQQEDEAIEFIFEGIQNASVSMLCVKSG